MPYEKMGENQDRDGLFRFGSKAVICGVVKETAPESPGRGEGTLKRKGKE
jgi:hypothetical protein